MPSKASTTPPRNAGTLRGAFDNWDRRDWTRIGVLFAFILALHAVGFGVLAGIIAPHGYQVGTEVFGIGLGVTAYVFGVRHAFDADHIAAIDNTTRKLTSEGQKPKTVGFWFSLGHSTIVFAMAAMVAAGARAVTTLSDETSPANQTLGLIGVLTSGIFLTLIGIVNCVALVSIWRVSARMRKGDATDDDLDAVLNKRGLIARVLAPVMRTIDRPWKMYPVGLLFGLGFDTATEIALLVLAGTGAAVGLPWYAVMVLPLLFTAGMTLMDTVDGLFMNVAYQWAFAEPLRKLYYNVTVTAISVAVALVIGGIELVGVLHEKAHVGGPVVTWISEINLNYAGFAIVGLFVIAWAVAIGYWKIARPGHRSSLTERSPSPA